MFKGTLARRPVSVSYAFPVPVVGLCLLLLSVFLPLVEVWYVRRWTGRRHVAGSVVTSVAVIPFAITTAWFLAQNQVGWGGEFLVIDRAYAVFFALASLGALVLVVGFALFARFKSTRVLIDGSDGE